MDLCGRTLVLGVGLRQQHRPYALDLAGTNADNAMK